MRRSAFTLVEILIVVSIIGILAALVVPHIAKASDEAVAVTLTVNVKAVRAQINQRYAQNGSFPATIDPTWFLNNTIPDHPENSIGLPVIQVLPHPAAAHPANKVLAAPATGAYWYNPTLGTFHARTTDKGSSQATLDFYNRVNGSEETALGNYGGGGGS